MLSISDQKTVVQAIREAENMTSGEIRVHIASHCKGNVLDRAADVFARLKMHKTELRNGTLIYIAPEDKQLAIIGDAGINAVVKENFWDEAVDIMRSYFKQDKIVEGLCKGIEEVGILLKQYFPAKENDVNELSDEISFD